MKSMMKIVGLAFLMIVVLIMLPSLFESNNNENWQVKQAVSGHMTFRNNAGVYWQGMGKITTYPKVQNVYFSTDVLDGGEVDSTDAVKNVRFVDGGKALDISGILVFKYDLNDNFKLIVHTDNSNAENFGYKVRQHLTECIMNTASFMKSEEVYAERRAEFSTLVQKQLMDGIYATKTVYRQIKGKDGNTMEEKVVELKFDDDNNPIVAKKSPIAPYGISVVQLSIKEINFDQVVEDLINKKKDAEKAKQDRVTAEEQGKAKIAEAEAKELVVKIQAVTQAEKEKEVAILNAQKEYEMSVLTRQKKEEDSKALLVFEKAQAEANKLKVSAGLTPQERAQFEIDKADKVSKNIGQAIANAKWPTVMSFGTNSGVNDPMTAVGINQMMQVVDKLGK